jgi:two-component system response regulator RegA
MTAPHAAMLVPALVIDDDDSYRTRLCRALNGRGFEAAEARDTQSALARAQHTAPRLILLDLKLGEENGLAMLPALREVAEGAIIIVLTGYGSISTALAALKQGADHYLTKPVDADQIQRTYDLLLSEDEGAPTLPEPSSPSLARVEWEHIQRVLADCGGNVSQAARVLGIHRRSLQRKLFKNPPRV